MEVRPKMDSDSAHTVQDTAERISQERRDLIEREEKKLKDLRQKYAKEKAAAVEMGQAAVNHIKQNIEENSQLLRDESQRENDRMKLAREKTYEQMQKEELHHRKSIQGHRENQLRHRDQVVEQGWEQIHQLQKNMEHEHRKLKNETQRLASDTESEISESLAELRKRGTDAEKKIRDEQLRKISVQQESFEAKSANQKLTHAKDTEALREKNRHELNNIQTVFHDQIESDKRGRNETLTKMQEDTERAVLSERTRDRLQIEKLRKDKQTQLNAEIQSAKQKMDYVRDHSAREVARVEDTADREIHNRKSSLEMQERRLKDSFQQEAEEKTRIHRQRMDEQAEAFEKQFGRVREGHHKLLLSEADQFKDKFNFQHKQHQMALNRQDLQYEKQRVAKQLSYMKDLNRYDSVANDPFYATLNITAQIREEPTSYVVTAQIPEHEMKNIQIRVQKDLVTIAGIRNFTEEIQDGLKTTSTNSHQTFKQEFKLEHPIKEKNFYKEYENGYLKLVLAKA